MAESVPILDKITDVIGEKRDKSGYRKEIFHQYPAGAGKVAMVEA